MGDVWPISCPPFPKELDRITNVSEVTPKKTNPENFKILAQGSKNDFPLKMWKAQSYLSMTSASGSG
jgi:hypothetical protein